MKKVLLISFLVACCSIALGQECPNGFSPHDTSMTGVSTSHMVPFGAQGNPSTGRYKQTSWSIYTRYELENMGITPGSIINSIGYNLQSGTCVVPKVSIYVKEVPIAAISVRGDSVSLDSMSLVYSSEEETFVNGWNYLALDSNITYSGTGNLMVAVHRDSIVQQANRYFYSVTGNSVVRYRSQSQQSYSSQLVSWRPVLAFGACVATPVCSRPSGLVGTSTDSSITVGYVSTALQFQARAGIEGFNPDAVSSGYQLEQVSSQNTVTISGLNSGVVYDVYVRGICGSDTTLWSLPVKVRTNCGVQTLPYSNTFSNTASIDSCFILHDAFLYNGYIRQSGTAGCFVLPEFDSPLNKLHIRIADNYTDDVVIFGTISNPYDTNTFTPIDSVFYSGYSYRETDFRSCSGLTGRVAIKFNCPRLDNLQVDTLSVCNRPTGVHVRTVTDSSAVVAWTSESYYAPSFRVYFWERGTSNDTVVTVYADSCVLTNLNAGKYYNLEVVSECMAGSVSEYSQQIVFMTECRPISQLPYELRYGNFAGNPMPCWNLYVDSLGGYYYWVSPIIDTTSIRMDHLEMELSLLGSLGSMLEFGVMDNAEQPSSFVCFDSMPMASDMTVYCNVREGRHIALRSRTNAVTRFNKVKMGIDEIHPVRDLMLVETTDTSLAFTWHEQGSATQWLFESVAFDGSDYRVTTVDTMAYTLTGLVQYSKYCISVSAITMGDTSVPAEACFRTERDAYHDFVVEQLGVTEYSFSSFCPIARNNKHSWNQHVYALYNYVVEGLIDTIWFDCRTAGSGIQDTSVVLYMCHVDSSYSLYDDWVPFDSLHIVYRSSGWPVTHTVGWIPIVLDTPFYYNGRDKLVLTFARSGTGNNGNETFYTFTELGGGSLHYYTNNESGVQYPTTITQRELYSPPMIRLSMLTRSCVRTDSLAVDEVNCRNVSLSWIERGEASQWQIHYESNDGEVEGSVVVDGQPHGVVEGLPYNHTYSFSVRPICGEGDTGYYFGRVLVQLEMNDAEYYSVEALSGNPDLGSVTLVSADSVGDSICQLYATGTQLVFSATPFDENTLFVGWGDGDTSNPRTITVTQDTVLTAYFIRYFSAQASSNNPEWGIAYIHLVEDQSEDSVSQGTFPEGIELEFYAAPNMNNSVFVGWDDGDVSNPRIISLVQDTTLTAIFEYTENIVTTEIETIRVMPNPTTDAVSVIAESVIDIIECCDVAGHIIGVVAPRSTSCRFDVGHWPLGMYLLKVTTKKGTSVVKLVVSNR